MLGKFYLYPFKFMNLKTNLSADSSTVILLIHGYARNQSDWLWFIKQLKTLTYPIYTVNLSPRLGSIQEIAKTSLSKKIQVIKQETNCQHIILVGHSMGGLVASYYSEFLDSANLIQKIITLGSPFYGSKICVAAAGKNGQQMRPGNPFTTELRAAINKSTKHYYQVATQVDNLIFPWQSQLLEHTPAEQQLVLPHASHLGLLHSKIVVEKIISWLS